MLTNCKRRSTSGKTCLQGTKTSAYIDLVRRSNFQYLESELAALDAQLKAAEEKLARAKEQGVVLPGETVNNENSVRQT